MSFTASLKILWTVKPNLLQISVENSKSAHAVIISGITIYSDHSVYTICDPNKQSKVYQNVSYAAMSDPSQFYYGSYTDWYRTIYWEKTNKTTGHD